MESVEAEPPREKKMYSHEKYTRCLEIKNLLWNWYLKIFSKPRFRRGGYPKTFFENLTLGGGVSLEGCICSEYI